MTKQEYRIAVVVALLGVGCAAPATPLDPGWGKQPCSHCHMLLDDRAHAAQIVTEAGERIYFDDVGCMIEYLRRAASASTWVRDAQGRWIAARTARYRAAPSPMGYGFLQSPDGNFDFSQIERAVAERSQTASAR